MSGPALLSLVRDLGFVQVDSIRTVERAHHMILFTRRSGYRPKQLDRLLERERSLFENWTHDAAVIPTEFFPIWQRRFAREEARLSQRWQRWRGETFVQKLEEVFAHVERHGPVRTGHLREEGHSNGQGWWDWAPSKTALEYLWRTGRLAVARREGFQKVYDLTESVIPAVHLDPDAVPNETGLIDWACRSALDRLGFATPGELARFWDGITPAEATAWCAAQGDRLRVVEVEDAEGARPRQAYAWADIEDRLAETPSPPGRLRVLSPFDPLLRDRQRTERLFGFSFRIEVFVPAAQRRFGYYVFPLLEGDRLIGRLDMKADREADALTVTAVWPEGRLRLTKPRMQKLEAELERLRAFAGCAALRFENAWQRPSPNM